MPNFLNGTFRLAAILGFLLIHASALRASPSDDPLGILLTWQRDPATTMTIDWHTGPETTSSTLWYRERGAANWTEAEGDVRPFPFSDRLVHRVELTGLEPDTDYMIRFGENGRQHWFRTMPAELNRPVRIAVGGDVRHTMEMMERTNRQAARYDPDFVAWGGDLAYADGREDRAYRWYEFFDALTNTLVAPGGRLIPVLAAIGNHEVRGGYHHNHDDYVQDDAFRASIAPYYFTFFAMPGQPGYDVLDFGDYMSFVLLDTDHVNPIGGAQTEWLEDVLRERQSVPHVFPIYHVPAYPTVRSFDGGGHQRVRTHWVPLFERYGLQVVFEAHDHAFKRTHPIREGSVRANGVVYIGDGAWGVDTREIGRDHDEEAWYLKKAASARHFILVTIDGPHRHFLVVDEDGRVIDEYPERPAVPDERERAMAPAEAH